MVRVATVMVNPVDRLEGFAQQGKLVGAQAVGVAPKANRRDRVLRTRRTGGHGRSVPESRPLAAYGPPTDAVAENTSVRFSRLPLLARTWKGLKPGFTPEPAKSSPA